MKRLPTLLTLLVLVNGCLSAGDSQRPNIIVILADDLGYSDPGCFGGEIHTPNLDNLAENGLRMTQLYNTARCCSTRASLLTGLHAHQAGVGAMTADNGLPGYRGFLTDRCVTIAELLQQAGYRTYLSGKWHLRGKGNPECLPVNRGFDEFYGHFRAYASFWRPDLYIRLPEGRERLPASGDFYATESITDHAIHFLDEEKRKHDPFFLYLAYNAPHFPLHAPKEDIDRYIPVYEKGWDEIRRSRITSMKETGILPVTTQLSPRGIVTKVPDRNRDSPWYGKSIPDWKSLPEERRADLTRRMATYAAMVEIMDRNIGRLIHHLKETNRLENTFIVFLSDNGACAEWDPIGFDNNPYPTNRLYTGEEREEMGQPGTFHSYGTGWANACNTPFRLYKHYNHEGGISSPTIVHWPKIITEGGRIDRQPAHLVDLSATILDLGNAEYPDTSKDNQILPLAGTSLLPVIEGQTLPTRPLFFEHEGNRAVRLGKWKIVWINSEKQWELYNISNDRTELNNLAESQPEIVEKLSELWHRWAEASFVEKQKVEQPASGMPKIYYLPKDETAAAGQIREMGGHAFLNLRSGGIKEINLNDNPLANDATMSLVEVCRDITDLSLENTAVGDFGIGKIAGFQKLEWLNLYQARITDAGLNTISKLPNLQHLPIGETAITDAGLAQLQKSKKLKYLGVRGTQITDAGIAHLVALKNLQDLHLGETAITDKSVSSLIKLRNLKKLRLHDTGVSAAGTQTLLENLRGLRELHLQRTHLTIGEVRNLRTKWPHCRILYESDS